ncbi:MAG: gliding motility-associated C-terminal domain-containing protein, partial [Cyclobacteriaceae bacterium]
HQRYKVLFYAAIFMSLCIKTKLSYSTLMVNRKYHKGNSVFSQWTRSLMFVSLFSIYGGSIAQTLNRAEYFFDTDPGTGNATPVAITPGATVDFTFNANISALSNGFHDFNFRIRDNTGKWSHFQSRTFYIVPTASLATSTSITRAEYFFDSDPGRGNGVSVSVTPGSSITQNIAIDITALTPGFHNLNFRAIDDRGQWSHFATRTFYIVPPISNNNGISIQRAEYFFDTDPGTGNGINVPVTPAATINQSVVIPVNSLSPGFHTLNFRARDDKGHWSHFATRSFYILLQPPVSTQLVRAEYFFDNDPGAGSATPLPITAGGSQNNTFALDISSLTTGFHRLGIRYRDNLGQWSHFPVRTFYVIPGNALPATTLTDLEYFIDTDPGIGSGTRLSFTPANVVDQLFAIDLSGLPGGDHDLFVRTRDSNGFWSTAMISTFTLLACTPPSPPVSASRNRCGPGKLTFDASGAAIGQIYRWYNDATITSPLFEGSTYVTDSIAVSRNYYVSVYDPATLCESTRTTVTATIVIIPKPSINLTGSLIICDGDEIVLRGPAGFSNYSWSNGLTIAEITVNTSGTYTLTVGDGTCTSPVSDAFDLTVEPKPTRPVILVNGPTTLCGAETTTLVAPPGFDSYQWSSGDTTRQIIVSASGDFTVKVFSATGCESEKSLPATITHFVAPAKPIIQTIGSAVLCTSNTSVILRAPYGFTVYEWSNGAITQEITVTQAGDYSLVTGNSASCLSVSSDIVTVTDQQGPCSTGGVDPNNEPPVIETTSASGPIDGVVTIPLTGLISDPDNNLDFTTLRITTPPSSGATATIDANNNLIIDYTDVNFAGTEELTIQICDLSGSCTQQQISMEIAGDIVAYNGLSPNGDGKNEVLQLEYIEVIPGTIENQVTIYNRWGNIVYEITNYNNTDRVFAGFDNENKELPNGIYYYKIQFNSGKETKIGYLTLRR